ncbi:MAG: hypothetical protein ABI068_11815 [Ktedonobacterales bacterium]
MWSQPYNQIVPPPPRPQVARRRARVFLVSMVVTLIAILVVIGLGVTVLVGPRTVLGLITLKPANAQISGVVYGDDIAAREAGTVTPTRIAATVTCNGASTQAAADGSYTLTVRSASAYSCAATAQHYSPMNATFAPTSNGDASLNLTLNFGSANSTGAIAACATLAATGATLCPELHPMPAMLQGDVTYTGHSKPAAFTTVTCWNDDAALAKTDHLATTYSATADAQGVYTLKNLPVDHYACVGGPSDSLHRLTLGPGANITLNMSLCAANCPTVSYHSGLVMHTFTAYLIFWLPAGYSLEPNAADDTQARTLIEQYFQDVGGTSFYGLLTQYWDNQGPVRNRATLGGVYFDTTPYPAAGTNEAPLYDDDITAAIQQAQTAKGWTFGPTHEFFVFTGYGVRECASRRSDNAPNCSFDHAAPQKNQDSGQRGAGVGRSFCGYHSAYGAGADDPSSEEIYAYISDTNGCADISEFNAHPIPYGDRVADALINVISHEQFESVSDADLNAWYDGHNPDQGELGDLCAYTFGAVQSDGANVTLAHGHRYILQQEWSNQANSCALR